MMKMKIQLNKEKMLLEGKYNVFKIIETLDGAFEDLELYRVKNDDDVLTYCGTDKPQDFAHFGVMYNALRKRDWFLDNVLLWELHEPIDYYDTEIDNIEDLLSDCREEF